LFDHTVGGWSKKTTIAYQATGQVSFADGHVFSVAAVDNTMPLCDTGHPEEAPCVYATPNRTFEGDDSGLTLPWTVT
jgi:prepilin-type processing-associated H-X9-DG protein